MDAADARALRRLLDTRPVAALATLHRGEPAVSMVPFVLPAGLPWLVIHVSALATHTRDLQEHPRASLLVMADAADIAATAAAAGAAAEAAPAPAAHPDADTAADTAADTPGRLPPQALPRVSLQVDARTLLPGHPDHESARAVYLARFPQSEITFGLADFSLVALQPFSARLVAGFGRAHGLRGDALDEWLRN